MGLEMVNMEITKIASGLIMGFSMGLVVDAL